MLGLNGKTLRFAIMLAFIVIMTAIVAGTYVQHAPVPLTAVTGIIAATGAMVIAIYKQPGGGKDT